MDIFKRYTIWLVSLLVIEIIVMLSTCLYLQPVIGDTTRLGGYSENDFGWNKPQKVFREPANPLQDVYDHYVDVLVLGDSFSFGGVLGMMNFPWQTILTAESGLSISTISHYTTKTKPPSYDPSFLPAILKSETFQKTPPKVFVLEVVERQLNKLPDIKGDCNVTNKIINGINILFKPIQEMTPSNDSFRPKIRPPLKEQLDFSLKYWETLLLLNVNDNPAFIFDLTTPNLFSNKRSQTLLVYEGDVEKKNWDGNLIASIKCKLINMQNIVQANGKTLFVVMIAPDKLTAYSPFLRDVSVAKYSAIQKIALERSLHMPRFDLPLQSAINSGMVDVYLSNDTHWASKGQQIAAETLKKYLIEFSGD